MKTGTVFLFFSPPPSALIPFFNERHDQLMNECAFRSMRAELVWRGEHLRERCRLSLFDELNERFRAERVIEINGQQIVPICQRDKAWQPARAPPFLKSLKRGCIAPPADLPHLFFMDLPARQRQHESS